jgi:hypothetical protein
VQGKRDGGSFSRKRDKVAKQTSSHGRMPIRQAIIGLILVIFSFGTAEVATRFGWLDVFEYTYYMSFG